MIHFVLCSAFLVSVGSTYIGVPGPKYPPTQGEVWPAPSQQLKGITYYLYNPSHLKIKVTSYSCTILERAVDRYRDSLTSIHAAAAKRMQRSGTRERDDVKLSRYLKELHIELTQLCEDYPQFNMDEKYTLRTGSVSKLKSDSIWGILRGLETFSQLMYISHNYDVRMNKTSINDHPRYPHRGLLLDTSRHYISLKNILVTLDGMSMNKMNVFHWHIVDDPSFPYQSERFPELSKRGAYDPTMVYSKDDIHLVINYARDRGIRVIPEFDVPGHTISWGAAYPSVLTTCYKNNKTDGLGPMDPININTYKLIKELYGEVQNLFRDKYFHVGGDEVKLDCWNSNPRLVSYMQKHNMSSAKALHKLFMKKTIPLLRNLSTPIVWQEVFDNGVTISNDTVVQVWKYGDIKEMQGLLKANKKILFSSSWYLDDYLGLSWQDFYIVDPRVRVGEAQNLENIIGGEACMWGEMVDDTNVVSRIWPRASAVAERLWTDKVPTGELARELSTIHPYVYNRLEEHTCRMITRGVGAQPPSGPGFCVS